MPQTGYHNDAYYLWRDWEDNDPHARLNRDNPRFFTDDGMRPSYATLLKRGFIRSAVPGKYTDRRLFFQFNPNVLTRDTSSQAGALPWLQDSSQLAIPTGTSAQFGFSLLFNREQEVASQRISLSNWPLSTSRERGAIEITDPQPDNVAAMGVLADLRILDEIIGVGFYNQVSIDDLASRSATATNDADITASPSGIGSQDPDLLRGNTVYMFQQPVRIVFSALFMVEGYVSSMGVTFQKFNFAMVPTVCTVSLSLEALYIGVARKKTLVTEYLDEIPRNSTTPSTVPDPGSSTTPRNNRGDIPGAVCITAPDLGFGAYPVNTPFSFQCVARLNPLYGGGTTENNPPLTGLMWWVSAAPPGLSMSADGLFSGTPTTVGTYRFYVNAADAAGNVAQHEVDMGVT